jgi:hypothetical protein
MMLCSTFAMLSANMQRFGKDGELIVAVHPFRPFTRSLLPCAHGFAFLGKSAGKRLALLELSRDLRRGPASGELVVWTVRDVRPIAFPHSYAGTFSSAKAARRS